MKAVFEKSFAFVLRMSVDMCMFSRVHAFLRRCLSRAFMGRDAKTGELAI